jgi:type III secretion protein J
VPSLLGAAVAIALLLAGCNAVVRGQLSEAQANQVVVALDGASIAAHKVAGPNSEGRGYRVEVAAGELNAALRVLQQQGLPAPETPGLEAMLEPSGLVATPEEERARLAAVTAAELARSIERIDGVVGARVHLVLAGASRPLDAASVPPQAAVLLVRPAGAPSIDERAVRTLVAGAVSGLHSSAVTVVQTQAARMARATAATARVGPFSVRRESAPLLKAVLALALLLNLVLAVALIWTVRRKRAAREATLHGA